jgi:prophage DNA circulation protein
MIRAESDECVALTATILQYLIAAVPQTATVGVAGAQIHADIGSLNATAAAQLASGTFSTSLATCFYDAVATGVDLRSMSNVRALILTLTPVSTPAVQVTRLAELYSLVMESKIIAAMTFTSSNQVEALIAQVATEFASAIEYAADVSDGPVYQAMIALNASVVNLLVRSTYALPRLVKYAAGKPLPALVLAQMLYADGGRADQLWQENQTPHPAFMPVNGSALSQ